MQVTDTLSGVLTNAEVLVHLDKVHRRYIGRAEYTDDTDVPLRFTGLRDVVDFTTAHLESTPALSPSSRAYPARPPPQPSKPSSRKSSTKSEPIHPQPIQPPALDTTTGHPEPRPNAPPSRTQRKANPKRAKTNKRDSGIEIDEQQKADIQVNSNSDSDEAAETSIAALNLTAKPVDFDALTANDKKWVLKNHALAANYGMRITDGAAVPGADDEDSTAVSASAQAGARSQLRLATSPTDVNFLPAFLTELNRRVGGLEKREKVMMLNLRPTEGVLMEAIVEDFEVRFGEAERREILEVCGRVFPVWVEEEGVDE